jgi:hypothetical protein
MKKALLTTALLFLVAGQASAQLVITEVMSFSATFPDWFELTNLGGATIDPTGYKMDDSSPAIANAVELLGISSIPSGQSVVYIEASEPGTVIPAFRTFWGGLAGVQIGSYSGSGVSLSGTSGDQVHVFNVGGTDIANVSFGPSPDPSSFGYNPNTGTFGAKSVAGQFGAFNSTGAPTHIGSPGTIGVPEPAAFGIGCIALAAIGAAARWRRGYQRAGGLRVDLR